MPGLEFTRAAVEVPAADRGSFDDATAIATMHPSTVTGWSAKALK